MTRHELIKQYNAGARDFRDADLRKANLGGVDLRWANLREADLIEADFREAILEGADLRWANLRWANLRKANLRWADLREADLRWANLRWADLIEANLRKANLGGSCLRDADLEEADLRWAVLPAPTIILLANWGCVSDELCLQLMRYDAACHPNPETFDDWNEGQDCPYDDCAVERAAQFREKRALWSPGPAKRPFDLMVACIREKCSNSDWHDTCNEE